VTQVFSSLTEMEHLDVVIRQHLSVYKLFSGKDEVLLSPRDESHKLGILWNHSPITVLNLDFNVVNSIRTRVIVFPSRVTTKI